ncbi:MAG: hypothetical protein ABID40_06375, partial [Candidatus Bipolaricaulota bacterium]
RPGVVCVPDSGYHHDCLFVQQALWWHQQAALSQNDPLLSGLARIALYSFPVSIRTFFVSFVSFVVYLNMARDGKQVPATVNKYLSPPDPRTPELGPLPCGRVP